MIDRNRALLALQQQQRYDGRGVVGLSYPAGEGPFLDEQLSLMLTLPKHPFIAHVPLPDVDPTKLTDPPFTLDAYIAAKNQLRDEDRAAQSQ